MRTTLPRRCIRTPVLLTSAALAWAFGSTPPLAGQDVEGGEPRPSEAVLAGTVLDVASDEPVVGARVALLRMGSDRVIAAADADSLGVFALPAVPAGAYLLSIQRIGYKELTRDLLLEGAHRTEVVASLVPVAMDIEAVVVTVDRSGLRAMRAFEERRALGMGSFVTREDIERRRPYLVTDLFRSVPGVRVVSDRQGDARLLLRGQCVPQLYIDGVASYEGMSLDLMFRPDDVEGIEVYTVATAPPQYARSACGVVVVWSRVPQRVQGRAGWWKPLLLVGGIMGALAVIR
jgi:hypothetical protein